MYFIYSALMALAVIVTGPYWLIQGLRYRKYLSNLRERLGALPTVARPSVERPGAIWIHAVSVGEALSGVALAKRLKEIYPQRPLVISTTTETGQQLAKERMPFADTVIFFPFDWAFSVRRVLAAVKPAIVIVLETEIWPNFLREARRGNVPVVFVSGRVSNRSFARYQKYLRIFGFFLRPFLASVLKNAAAFLMQTEADADRIRALGAPEERVQTSGNLKYDMELPAPTPFSEWLKRECEQRRRWPVVVAGSVVATEEPLALIAFGVVQGDFPKALLVLAPRKPERFAAAASSSKSRTENSLGALRLRFRASAAPGKAPLALLEFQTTSRFYCSTASASLLLFTVSPTAFLSEARSSKQAATTFSNPPRLAKCRSLGLPWKTSRRLPPVSWRRAQRFKCGAPRTPESSGSICSRTPKK